MRVLLVLVCLVAVATGQSLDEARAAFRAKDWKKAEELLRPLATAGDADAQSLLGRVLWSRRAYDEAVGWHRKAADQGDSFSLAQLGDAHLFGYGVPVDPTAARRWYRQAADKENLYACFRTALCLRDGIGGPRDLVAAGRLLRKAEDGGLAYAKDYSVPAPREPSEAVAKARRLLGHKSRYWEWWRGGRPPDAGVAILEPAAKAGDVEAMTLLGELVYPAEPKRAVALWLAAATADAVSHLAYTHKYGKGGHKRDAKQSQRLYRDAAQRGSAEAQYAMARIDGAQRGAWYQRAGIRGHANGARSYALSLYRNERERSLRWYRYAAGSLNDPLSQMALGREFGKKDPAAARLWFERAAAQEHLPAMYELGKLTKDPAVAANWYRTAAVRGRGDAARELGLAYRDGRGVPKDLKQADFWLRRAWGFDRRARAARAALPPTPDTLARAAKGARLLAAGPAHSDFYTGIELLRTAAHRRSGAAALTLGDLFATGKQIPPRSEAARYWYKLAAKLGKADEVVARSRWDALPDHPAARRHKAALRQRAASGDTDALTSLGHLLAVEGAADESMLLLWVAGDNGQAPALTALGARFEARGSRVDALAFYRRAAEAGDKSAAAALGRILLEDGEVEAGERWARRAGDLRSLARCDAVDDDALKRAADAGHAWAHWQLALAPGFTHEHAVHCIRAALLGHEEAYAMLSTVQFKRPFVLYKRGRFWRDEVFLGKARTLSWWRNGAMLIEQAAKAGHEGAKRWLEEHPKLADHPRAIRR